MSTVGNLKTEEFRENSTELTRLPDHWKYRVRRNFRKSRKSSLASIVGNLGDGQSRENLESLRNLKGFPIKKNIEYLETLGNLEFWTPLV